MAAPRQRWLSMLKAQWLLILFGALTLMLAVVDPLPLPQYMDWLQTTTLAGLAGLLIAIQGIRDSGVVQRWATALVRRAHSTRMLGVLLVSMTAILAMVLTNDVSLFLIVPLTVTIGSMSNVPVARMVVLEALAVNAGSTLSPIGNPQNLLLWQHSGKSFVHFAVAMAPPFAVMAGLLMAFTVLWLPAGRVKIEADEVQHASPNGWLCMLSLAALLGMVLAMEFQQAMKGVLIVVAVFLLLARRSLMQVDWLLLLTFAAIFLGLGHVAALPCTKAMLDQFDFTQPLMLYLGGIVTSQLISNVPATVLLLDRTRDTMELALAVNVGGYGVAMGSLANLIALRLARLEGGIALLHRASLPFLIICAPLAWWAWRWFG